MPKIRSVDPFFWDDPEIAPNLTRDERLLMIGCWTKLADDEGRFLADPGYVRKQVFGYDDLPISEISRMLRKISEVVRSWTLYTVGAHQYIQIDPRTWKKHQDIRWVVRSKLPQNIATSEDCGNSPKDSEDCGNLPESAADFPRATRARVVLSSVALPCLASTSQPSPGEALRMVEWPLTSIEIRKHFPAASDLEVLAVVQACSQAFVSMSGPDEERPTDKDFADAVKLSHFDGQGNVRAYRTRASQVIKTWIERTQHYEKNGSK